MIRATVNIVRLLLTVMVIVASIRCLKLKQKKTIVLCCCCIVAFSFLSLKFTRTFFQIKEDIIVTALHEKCEESRGTEVDISSLYIDKDVTTSFDVAEGHWYSIAGCYSWREPEDTRWDGTASERIKLKIPVGWVRSIQFYGNPWRGYVAVERPNGTIEYINTYSDIGKIHTCEIGRSNTKLLLLQEIVNIFCYTVVLAILTFLLVWIIRKEKLTNNEKSYAIKKEKYHAANPKRKWKRSIHFAVSLAILLALFAISNLRGRINTEAVVLAPADQVSSEPITAQERYIQTFTSNGTFNQIQLRFCTYGRENELSTTVKLVDDTTDNVLEIWEIDNSSVDEDTITFEQTEKREKGTYKLIVEGHNPNAETSIGIYLQNSSVYKGNLFVSGSFYDKSISIGLYQRTNLGYYLLTGILFAAVICTWIAYVLLFILKPQLWKTAFILIMCYGCVYLAIFPAGCVNDSWRHYVTAYQYSNKLLGIETSAVGTVMMRTDDCNEFLRYRGLYCGSSIATYYEESDEFSLFCKNSELLDCGERSLDREGVGSAASGIAYFPQVLGLTLGRLLSLGTILCMFLARFFQLLSVAALVSTAIQIIPREKEVLLLISLLPIFLQQITAFSYDGIAFGFAFLFLAACIRLKTQTEKMSAWNYMLVLITAIGLCACRGGMYVFLFILLFLIPKQVMGTLPKVFLLGMGVFTISSLFIKSYLYMTPLGSNTKVLIYGSPFHHPIDVGLHFLSTIIENIDDYCSGSFGWHMGWGEKIPPQFVAFGFILMILVMCLKNDNDVEVLARKTRVIYLFPVIMVLGLCLGLMYLGEAHRATKWNIWGVQGRYLIPVMPLLFFQVKNRFIVMRKNIRPAVVYAFCVWEVLEIFYLMRVYVTR